MAPAADRDAAWEAFLSLWEELLEAAEEPGTAIVVEGENDVRSLRALGIAGRIEPLHRGQRLPELARTLATSARRVVLLFDWDTQGGRWTHQLLDLLAPGPLEVDQEIRRRLARALRGDLVHVEGLHRWASRTAEAHGASLEHFRPGTPG